MMRDLLVVETAGVLAGPAVGMFFAELGARVIKIENKRAGGDVTRRWKLPEEDPDSPVSAYFCSVNWGKDHRQLDLKEASDRATFDWMLGQITRHPELGLGGPSMQWTYAALEEMARLYVAPLPKVPVLTLLGTEETVVSTSVIRAQLDKMEAGELVLLGEARHEIFMEVPATLETAWRHIDDFLARVPLRRGAEALLSR